MNEKARNEKCHYMAAAYPDLPVEDTCGKYGDHRHDEATFSLARALAVASQHPNPTDEQVAWFLADAAAVVDDFDPGTASWQVTAPQLIDEPGLEFALTINQRAYVVQESCWEPSHPVARDTWRSWFCTCGMEEQERTGHDPQHEDWCDLSEDDDDPRVPPAEETR